MTCAAAQRFAPNVMRDDVYMIGIIQVVTGVMTRVVGMLNRMKSF